MSNELLHRRAELLAELFLQDLRPSMLTHVTLNSPFGDFYAVFQIKKGRVVTITVEVKATEKPVSGVFRFHASNAACEAMQNSNIPVLVLVVDVKANEIHFNWASKANVVTSSPRRTATLSLPVRKATETSKKELRSEIESK